MEERRNWGNVYIGLDRAAEQVQRFVDLAMEMPRHVAADAYLTLHSPTIWEGITDVLRDTLYWLNPVHSFPFVWAMLVKPFLEDLKAHVWDRFTGYISRTWPMITGIFGFWIHDVKVWLWDRWNEAVTHYQEFMDWLWETFPTLMHSLNAMIASIRLTLEGLWAGVVSLYWTTRLTMSWWWNTTVWPWLTGIWGSVVAWYTNIRASLRAWWFTVKADVLRFVVHWVNVIWPWIIGLPERIWLAVQLWWKDVTFKWETWWRELRLTSSDRIIEAVDTLGPVVGEWFGHIPTIPGNYMNALAALAGTNLALQPHRALATVGAFFGVALGAGTAAHILATALNSLPFTNWVGASQLAGLVAQASGFDELTKATYGVLINDALTWPMRYHWNNMLRPKIPTEGSIFIMGRKRGLTAGEFKQAMAYQGLPDWWIDKEYNFFWTDPSPYWLLRMSEHATPAMEPSARFLPWLEQWLPNWRADPWAWFKMKLLLAGFEDTDIKPFIEGFRQRRLGPARTQLKTSVRAMLREAYYTKEDAWGVLGAVGVRTDELEYIWQAEDIDYQNRYNDDQVRYYSESFRKGELSAQDLSLMLSTFIVRPERVAQIVARELVRARPKTKPPVTVKQNPHVRRLISQAVTSWTKAWRGYEIEEGDLLMGLTIVLQDRELAHQLVQIELTRYRPPPVEPPPPPEDPVVAKARRDAITFRIEQFRDGEITAEVLELALAALIPIPDLVRQIVDIEKLRARPVPTIIPPWQEDPALAAVREETVRAHLEMFRKRLIGVDELFTYLLADGLARELARATSITQALKRIKTPPWDSPYFERGRVRDVIDEAVEAYSGMFVRGEISIAEFRANAVAAGLDPDIAIYLADQLELQRFVGPEGVSY